MSLIKKYGARRVILSIQSSREAMSKYVPIDKVEVDFEWDRKTDLAKAAYEAAKTETHTVVTHNPKLDKFEPVTHYGVLYGWQDDIVK